MRAIDKNRLGNILALAAFALIAAILYCY